MKKNTDENCLMAVDISDALSERDRVRFTVHTRTKLPQFSKPFMSVVRQHEEFIWLHDCLEENDNYAGYIIPPVPPRPDFDSSREKLQRLGDGESSMSKDEFLKMKQELEAEYLAIFKKTVAMHEIFLQRIAAHEKFREDNNFKIFLEYENELSVRCKSTKERLADSIQHIGKSISDLVISTSQVDEQYFERERIFLSLYHNSIKETATQADKVCHIQKCLGDSYLNLAQNLVKLASVEAVPIATATIITPNTIDNVLPPPVGSSGETNNNNDSTHDMNNGNPGSNHNSNIINNNNNNIMNIPSSSSATLLPTLSLSTSSPTSNEYSTKNNSTSTTTSSFKTCALVKIADYFEQARKIEIRIASDEDLKLSDTFLYYKRETVAAQDLLMRRLKFMSEYESAMKNLDKARQKGGTQMQYAEVIEKQAKENFVNISKLAKKELLEYKQRRVEAFKKAFKELADLELKHLKTHTQLITSCLESVKQLS